MPNTFARRVAIPNATSSDSLELWPPCVEASDPEVEAEAPTGMPDLPSKQLALGEESKGEGKAQLRAAMRAEAPESPSHINTEPESNQN